MLVQKLRLQRGWSQEQLADVAGLSVRTIQRIERGQTASLETQKALACVFEIEIPQLQEPQMPNPATNAAETEEMLAFAHVRRVRKFYISVVHSVVIVIALFIVNLVTNPDYLWAFWPAFGIGLALLTRGLTVFNRLPFLNADWEKREAEKFLGHRL